jgi:hypothetical protein
MYIIALITMNLMLKIKNITMMMQLNNVHNIKQLLIT